MPLLRRSLKVGVLGCGPTGLFAVHALVQRGYGNVSILSRKRRSEMFGAQYLHEPIPGLTEERDRHPITYLLHGSPAQYAEKVYGKGFDPSFTSPVVLPKDQVAYDIRAAYYKAWELYSDQIINIDIQPSYVAEIKNAFDLVVCTLPAPQLCADKVGAHHFKSQKVWAIGDAPERGIFCPVGVLPWTVECNGNPTPGWYRASHVFGYKTAEWPEDSRPPIEGVASVEKPIGTNCDCWLDKGFMRAGRYGTWTKGVLSHQVYYDIARSH